MTIFAPNAKTFLTSSVTASVALALLGACSQAPNITMEARIEAANGHWLSQNIFISTDSNAPDSLQLHSEDINGETSLFALDATELPTALKNKFPHLAKFSAYKLDPNADPKSLLKGNNRLLYQVDEQAYKAAIQTYGALDDLYTSGENDANEVKNYGAVVSDEQVSFTLWAPTANKVSVLLFDEDKKPLATPELDMHFDATKGIWQTAGSKELAGKYYRYKLDVFHPVSGKFETLEVTDPYSLSLSTNSLYSQIVDLNAVSTQPQDWNTHPIPTVAAPEDLILYETHIRDFSASDKNLSNPLYKGKYKAFSETNSDGMKHLNMLRDAGLNTVHLLPTYDLSTINEDPKQAIDIDAPLSKVCGFYSELSFCNQSDLSISLKQKLQSFDPRSGDAQAVMEVIRGNDNYNWGYDPFHYTVPEGSYAVNPDGESRIVEFREMVQNLHTMGFKVIMDVVYNHTFASGLHDKSVLDKVVPGYYHRYKIDTGAMEMSTCCDNSATEHAMMEKLMVDSLVVWARDYKIDGFRFDLMGHQPKDAMLRAREAVKAVDADTYFYGEGWNFGEVANNSQFIQASQSELSGTEIGTFTDRMRDAIRGGNFMTNAEGLRRDQGIGNGLFVVPNELQPEDKQLQHYQNSMAIVRLGLAANLTTFEQLDDNGQTITGLDVKYGDSPAAYAKDPADTINYVSKHDNQSLWDNHQYRLPYDMPAEQRVRVHNLSLAYPMLAQGIPFIHMGSELLRSKAFLRDSYDYGDWYNAVDFSYQSNNYDVGLPPAQTDEGNWPIISKVLENNGTRDDVSPAQIKFAAEQFADWIKIRMSSKLLRLETEQQILQQVKFLNTGPNHQAGLIVMQINDNQDNLDPMRESLLVIFNNNVSKQMLTVENVGQYQLHPVQKNGADDIVKQTKIGAHTVEVPAFSAVVLSK